MLGAIRSEVRKVFTTRLWWGMALGLAVLAALISMGFAALVGLDNGGQGQDDAGNPFARMTLGTAELIYNAGLVQNFTTLIPLALGVLLITTEYRHQTITATFLSTPKRSVVLVSKIVAVAVVGAVYAVIHAAASVAGGGIILSAVKHQSTFLGESEVWRSLGIGVLAVIIWMLLGFGFGMLVRNQIAAVLTAVGVSFVAHIALNILFSIKEWSTAGRFLPGNLTTSMLIQSDPTGGAGPGAYDPYLDWWVAALVLAAYALVLSVIGAFLTTRRDVT